MSASQCQRLVEAWRDAERRRDALDPASRDWARADVEAKRARAAYRAHMARLTREPVAVMADRATRDRDVVVARQTVKDRA